MAKLTRRTYTIPAEMLSRILEHLHLNWFEYDDDGESYNNDDVISLTEELEECVKKQQEQEADK